MFIIKYRRVQRKNPSHYLQITSVNLLCFGIIFFFSLELGGILKEIGKNITWCI